VLNWWDADEYDNVRMFYPDPKPDARMRRLALTTDPEMVRTSTGALRLRLVNRHPHERVRVFRGPCRAT
jgi:hypothetical protein